MTKNASSHRMKSPSLFGDSRDTWAGPAVVYFFPRDWTPVVKATQVIKEVIIGSYDAPATASAAAVLAYAGAKKYGYAQFLPPSGRETSTGEVKASVVISSQPVTSPIVLASDIAILAADELFLLYRSLFKPHSVVLLDTTRPAAAYIDGKNFSAIPIPATSIAQQLGRASCKQMVMLAALAQKTDLFSLEELKQAQRRRLAGARQEELDVSEAALQHGYEHGRIARISPSRPSYELMVA
jgi:2-oxoglutarate ferredoxin oxidoreductase subunit gamma